MADAALVISLVLMALVFDFINGFHDAANSIAKTCRTTITDEEIAIARENIAKYEARFGTIPTGTTPPNLMVQ
jgi:phosphate/sulfate permease